jgi:hypothetical protein
MRGKLGKLGKKDEEDEEDEEDVLINNNHALAK